MKGKIVLVTGSAQGIGREIALKFSALKASVVLNDVEVKEQELKNLKHEIEKAGNKSQYFLADVSKMDQVQKTIQEIKKKFGKLDVLVNNAGVCRDKTLAKMTEDEWKKVIDIDLTGVFNFTKAALPLIIEGKGKIINISSVIGQRGNFGQTNYAAAKAGIIGFTKALAKEMGRFGVTVNAIAPGFIKTKLTENLPEEVKMTVKRLTALGKFGEPRDVAELVSFLASEKASFITGAVINIDGGLSL